MTGQNIVNIHCTDNTVILEYCAMILSCQGCRVQHIFGIITTFLKSAIANQFCRKCPDALTNVLAPNGHPYVTSAPRRMKCSFSFSMTLDS